MTALERIVAISRGDDLMHLNGAEGLLVDAIAELARRQGYIFHLLQTLGLAQSGWKAMEYWEESRRQAAPRE